MNIIDKNNTTNMTPYTMALTELIDNNFDWARVAIGLITSLDDKALAEFQKDLDVVVEDSDTTRPISLSRLNEQKKNRRGNQRRKDITHAQARLNLLKALANPTFLANNPKVMELGRYNKARPFDHRDAIYLRGDKKQYNRRSFKSAIDEGMEEYIWEETQRKAAEAERKVAEEEGKKRLANAKQKAFMASLDEDISADNANMEIVYLREQIEALQHQLKNHMARKEAYTAVMKSLEAKESITEEELCSLDYALAIIDAM